MIQEIYKNYLIEEYEETQLVGGPYENNEERQYRKTGKKLFRIKPGKKNLPEPGHWSRSVETLALAKSIIDRMLNKRRTKSLQTRHEKLRIKYVAIGDELKQIERELGIIGADYHHPDIYGRYL